MSWAIDYVNALFTVFMLIVLARILISYVPVTTGRPIWGAILRFLHGSTDWLLGFFRRIIPPVGILDLSPMVALIVLYIADGLVVRLLESF